MSDNYIELTQDEFDARYPLKSNHLNPSAGWALGDAGGASSRPTAKNLPS